MGFEVFNLQEALREYNRTAEGELEPISIKKTFGIQSFSPAFTSTLQTGFGLYKDSKFKHTGVTALSREIVENLKTSFDEYMTKINQSPEDKDREEIQRLGKEVRGTLREHHQNQLAQINFQHRQDSVDSLLSPKLWEEFSKIAQNNEVKRLQLEEIQRELQGNGRFCTHAHESLLYAYDVLLNLKPHLTQCRNDFEKAKKRRINRLPEYVLQKWEAHLDAQEAVFKKESDDIVLNMQARLNVAAGDPSLKNADVLCHFVEQLKSKGFIKSTFRVPQIKDDELAEESFMRFHAIIEHHDHEPTKKNLFELPWFGGAVSDKKSVRETFAVRYEVAELVPKSSRRPEFLFYGTNLRFNWFNNYLGQARIDAALSKVATQKRLFVPLLDRVPHLEFAEREFQVEEARIDKAIANCKKGLRRFFTAKTVSFLENIRTKLNEQRINLFNEKVDVLVGIVGEFDSSSNPTEVVQAFNVPQLVSETRSNIETLEDYFQKLVGTKDTVNKKIEALKKKFSEQEALLNRRLRIVKVQDDENEAKVEKERHEEALLAPFYSDQGPNPHEINLALDYLELARNSISNSYTTYIKEIGKIYECAEQEFEKNLGVDGNQGKLKAGALFLNGYKELVERNAQPLSENRRAAIELCKKGDAATSDDEALSYYQDATESDPNYLTAWRKKGETLWALYKEIASSDDELSEESGVRRLNQSVTYLHAANECFEKPLSLDPRYLHPLVRETIAEKAKNYFCLWIGISGKGEINKTQLGHLHGVSAYAEEILISIACPALAERVSKMKETREARTDFNALEALAKESLLFLVKTMPFTLQDAVDKDFGTLEEKLFKFLRKQVKDFKYDETQIAVLEEMLREITATKAFTYADLEKLKKSKAYLAFKPEVHFVLSVVAKLRFEQNRIAKVVEPSDKKSGVQDVNGFFSEQKKVFFSSASFSRNSQAKLAKVLEKHGSFRASLDKITTVETAVKAARYTH